MGQLIRLYFNSDMRCAHEGLTRIAKKDRLHVKQLKTGQFVIFLNRKATIAKIFCPRYVLLHLKDPEGHRLMLEALRYLPSLFDGKHFNYTGAVEKALKDKLK